MKSQFLSIFSSSTEKDAVETDSVKDAATRTSVEAQPRVASYRARYQEFLSQSQSAPIQYLQPRSYQSASAFRFVQGIFSFAVFLALFLTILTLFGFGLSSLGVIAQVSPRPASASSKQDNTPAQAPPIKEVKKKAKRH